MSDNPNTTPRTQRLRRSRRNTMEAFFWMCTRSSFGAPGDKAGAMQRRHSSNTEGMPPERNRSQTLGSESSLDEGGVFDCLKPDSPTSPQQLFSGLVGVSAGNVSSAPFQAAGLVLGSPPDVFIQMASSTRDEASSHRTENPPYLPRPSQHHHHHHHHHHHSGQHRSALLHAATSAERHSSREDGGEDASTPAPALSELKAVVTWLQRGFPFILILLAKVCFQHKLGIAVCIGMISTFAFANSTLKHQVALREERSVFTTLWIMVFLAGNIVYVYYTFSTEELHNSLIFAKPNINSFDFFDLIWAVGITDFVLKYFTIELKCFILFLPKMILAFKSRGKFYLLIEELSQLFRALVPIQLWYKYIMGEDPSSSYFLGAMLIIIYSLCKSFDLCGRISGIRKAFIILCSSQNYGMRASAQQCGEAGDVCAICQAEFREPVALLCQHVFCEECLCLWFDRERTCPLCRSTVVETLRNWKDGTTSAHFQIY
ncbi:E3 ubiquitin-protein ligase RNFT2 isoform X1 [Danio rerio]|uniref:E3 ubiquitin-protein ligase RNFT2 isoform X1 n=3 Tax=Danio rerio TaxID=7955 RepID=A0A8M2BCC1_DANRE|nr:RING finger and transmembrane domain-containing protein 2 isoform X1 [Danio rerio]XP_021331831.1 RING finger and transmembrane domain-containing protein 2 isoform X1 [Danio rerio]|eukprot:XP_005165099.1 RING finger and transmembrane domain-containing protein 2 isoform X1 [Danio rerio]